MKILAAILLPSYFLQADILYETDFDDFPTGANQWAGFDGWVSNDTTSGAQSIDETVLPALLKTASLGFERPNADFTFVALNLGYDHVTSEEPIVEIDTLLGIEDSTNNRGDDFYLSIYNSAGSRLSSIRFDNQDPNAAGSLFGIWWEDGVSQFDTLFDFIPGELLNLVATLDLENGTWSADIGGIPLFTEKQLTATNHPVDLGFVAFEWDVSSPTLSLHGDNFLLVADIVVRTLVDPPKLKVSSSFARQGDATLSWQSSPGWSDQVQYSTDLVTWLNSLPNSTFGNVTSASTINFTDESAGKGLVRFYRVLRTQAR